MHTHSGVHSMPPPLMRLLAFVDRPSVVQTLQCFVQCFVILLLHLFVDRKWSIAACVQNQMCLLSQCINASIPRTECTRAHTHTWLQCGQSCACAVG